MSEMPRINLEHIATRLSVEDMKLVWRIVNPKTGRLRATKPSVPRMVRVREYHWDYDTAADAEQGLSAYIWRMVAFHISPKQVHQCYPAMAMCYLPGQYGSEEYNAASERGDVIVDAVVDSVPKDQWYGVRRWANALGM